MPVRCPHCGREFKGEKLNARHLNKCAPHLSPKIDPCLCGHESTSATQMKRHRQTCEVWKGRDKKAVFRARQQVTLESRYGDDVTNPRHVPGAEEKRSATNLERLVLPGSLREPVGAGDVVKKVTDALGVRPCSKCEQRRRRLNRAFAFGRRKRA